jgi:hypothetical protein
MKYTLRNLGSALVAGGVGLSLLAGPLARPAAADDIGGTLVKVLGGSNSRQGEKNAYRNIGVGLGAAAVYAAVKGKTTAALALGAGAAYSAKKYEDARKAQNKENAYRNAAWYRNDYRNGYTPHGQRVSYAKKHHGNGKGHSKHGCR